MDFSQIDLDQVLEFLATPPGMIVGAMILFTIFVKVFKIGGGSKTEYEAKLSLVENRDPKNPVWGEVEYEIFENDVYKFSFEVTAPTLKDTMDLEVFIGDTRMERFTFTPPTLREYRSTKRGDQFPLLDNVDGQTVTVRRNGEDYLIGVFRIDRD